MEPTLSKKEIDRLVKCDVLKLFGIPMFLFVAFMLVIAGMIMYNRYALPLNTILIVDGIAVSVLSAFVGYLALYHKHEENKIGKETPVVNYFLIPMLLFIAFILVIVAMIMHNRYAIPWNTILIVDAIVGIVLVSCICIPLRFCENRYKAEYGC